MNDKQKEILMYLSKVPCATIDDIYANVSFSYYCNENKHLGNILSRMVKSGKIERVRKGIFRYVNAYGFIKNLKKLNNENNEHNQMKLF